ncbi:MAG: hypothetical protein GFH25_541218n29 [Chloroflexi bacterium AL-N10]|nr:hypothetical protein [Chloroflexi bacterium AL-N1]NOK69891.1 hypothetical protein [Chloroflexi bacterium AL-N10]NOK73812.1 hypothetical protein [Chloroflexi bacterium AL-N5]NOK91624.1 hypothetical protein [Chloroflexi bacterium AL-N15]
MTETYSMLFCRTAIVIVFTLSVLGKMHNVNGFRESIIDFRLVPSQWAGAIAWGFLISEALVVVFVLLGGTALLIGMGLAASLLLLFAVALTVVIWRKQRVHCNCFGRNTQWVSPYDVIRNIVLICCALYGFVLANTVAGHNTFSLSIAEIVLVLASAVSFVALVTNLADIIETLRQPINTGQE